LKGIHITGKDIGFIITIITLIITFTVKFTTMQNMVDRHERLIQQYNIPVMNEQMKNISEDIGEVKQIVKALSDHVLTL